MHPFNALLFLYRHVLNQEFGQLEGVVRAKRKPYVPVVLSREEMATILQHLPLPYALVVKLLYGCGLRLSECLQLRVHGLNGDAGVVTIHDGQGGKTARCRSLKRCSLNAEHRLKRGKTCTNEIGNGPLRECLWSTP